MMSTADRLVHMANQIARNLAIHGEARAALEVADHIAAFWDPRMKASLLAMEPARLDPVAARAAHILRTRGAPGSQTPATAIAQAGGSDAG